MLSIIKTTTISRKDIIIGKTSKIGDVDAFNS
jgi:hypothetical protein